MPRPKTAAEKKAAAEEKRKAKETRNTTIDALRKDIGARSFELLPEVVFDIDTYTFDYRVEKPTTNPHLTVWALINALKGCSYKGHEAVDKDKMPRLPKLRTKPNKNKIEGDPYALNFTSGQNCDAMLRHLYGGERGRTTNSLDEDRSDQSEEEEEE